MRVGISKAKIIAPSKINFAPGEEKKVWIACLFLSVDAIPFSEQDLWINR